MIVSESEYALSLPSTHKDYAKPTPLVLILSFSLQILLFSWFSMAAACLFILVSLISSVDGKRYRSECGCAGVYMSHHDHTGCISSNRYPFAGVLLEFIYF